MELGSFVCVMKTMELKTIVDVEIINGEKIFYMEDSTSYHAKELSEEPIFLREGLLQKMKKNKKTLEETLFSIARGW